MIDVARALGYAHGMGIVHGDIKPSNLIVDRHGRILVLDFGLAKLRGRDAGERRVLEGTPQYMSPEQIAGTTNAFSPSIDVYALGACIYELLTLRPMYAPGPSMVVFQRIATESPPSPRKLNLRIHRSLEAIVIQATSRAPRNRYPSMEALADDLQRFLRHQSVSALRGQWSLSSIVEEIRGNRILKAASLLMALGGVAALCAAYSVVSANLHARQERQRMLAVAIRSLDDADRLCAELQAPVAGGSGSSRKMEQLAIALAGNTQRARESLAALRKEDLAHGDHMTLAVLDRRAWRIDVIRAAFVRHEIEFDSEVRAGIDRGWNAIEPLEVLERIHCLARLQVRLAHTAAVRISISWINPMTHETEGNPIAVGTDPLIAARLLAAEYLVLLRDDAGREISFPYFVAAGVDAAITVPIAPKEVPDGMCYVPSYPGEEHVIGDEVTRQGDLLAGPVGRIGQKMTASFFIDLHETTNTDFAQFWNSQSARGFIAQAVDEFGRGVDGAEQLREVEHTIDALMEEGPEGWSFRRPESGKEMLPVTVRSPEAAEAFAMSVNKVLPTETQWEKAARGIDGRSFVYGDVYRPEAHYAKECLPAGSRPMDSSVYGVKDMMASVPEWTRTASGQGHIIRGGTHDKSRPIEVRLTIRSQGLPAGLRLVSRDPAPDLLVAQTLR
jgi:hypothetical protein